VSARSRSYSDRSLMTIELHGGERPIVVEDLERLSFRVDAAPTPTRT